MAFIHFQAQVCLFDIQHFTSNQVLFAATILQFFTRQAFLFVEAFGFEFTPVCVVILRAPVVGRVSLVLAYS